MSVTKKGVTAMNLVAGGQEGRTVAEEKNTVDSFVTEKSKSKNAQKRKKN